MATTTTTKSNSVTQDKDEMLRRSASLMYQMLKRIADEKEAWTVPMVKKVLAMCRKSVSF